MGWVKTQPEAFLADPTRTIILRTQATRGIILSNPRDQNLTTSWFDMHCSTIFANDFLHALLHHPTIPWILILFCQSQSKLTEKWEKNFTRAWPEPNFTNLSWDPTQARSDNPKPDLRPEKRTRPIPTQLTSSQHGSDLLSLAQLGSAWLNFAQLGSALLLFYFIFWVEF